MNLPDVNEMYPQEESIHFCNCTFCGTEIRVGDEVVKHDDLHYCDRICMATELLRSGEAKQVVAGE